MNGTVFNNLFGLRKCCSNTFQNCLIIYVGFYIGSCKIKISDDICRQFIITSLYHLTILSSEFLFKALFQSFRYRTFDFADYFILLFFRSYDRQRNRHSRNSLLLLSIFFSYLHIIPNKAICTPIFLRSIIGLNSDFVKSGIV